MRAAPLSSIPPNKLPLSIAAILAIATNDGNFRNGVWTNVG